MNKIYKIIALAMMMVAMVLPSNVFAKDMNETEVLDYQTYLQLQEDDVVGTDVSYEDLLALYEDSKALEQALEESGMFESFKLRASITLRAGDILVTNGTSSSMFVGHAAIAKNSKDILHTAGIGKTPSIISRSDFESKYGAGSKWVRVYRPSSATAGQNAAKWACKTYEDSGAKYKITSSLATTNETYCSKIVFQAYYYGVSKNIVKSGFTLNRIVSPYEVAGEFNLGKLYTFPYIGAIA